LRHRLKNPLYHWLLNDDVNTYFTPLSNSEFDIELMALQGQFFGAFGSDGTVGQANKKLNQKLLEKKPIFFAQGYSFYDSKKSGAKEDKSHITFR